MPSVRPTFGCLDDLGLRATPLDFDRLEHAVLTKARKEAEKSPADRDVIRFTPAGRTYYKVKVKAPDDVYWRAALIYDEPEDAYWLIAAGPRDTFYDDFPQIARAKHPTADDRERLTFERIRAAALSLPTAVRALAERVIASGSPDHVPIEHGEVRIAVEFIPGLRELYVGMRSVDQRRPLADATRLLVLGALDDMIDPDYPFASTATFPDGTPGYDDIRSALLRP